MTCGLVAGLASHAGHAAAATQGSSSVVVYNPSATVNRTPTGSIPTGSWTPTAPQDSGVTSSAADPATAAVASQSANAGSPAAGAGLGVQGFYGLETFGLNSIDDLQAQVNLSNGNLVVHATDLKINAPGLSVHLDRFFNSKSTGSGAFGNHAVMSTGRDVGLQVGSSSVTFTGPSGFTAVFTGTGPKYTTPAGVNADLVKNSGGTFTLTYRHSAEKLTFTAGGFLTSDADKNGNTISLAYNTDNTLSSLTDTAGRVTTFQYLNGLISQYTDPSGRHDVYTYDSPGNLTQTQDSNSGVTKYTYNSSNQLTRIQTPANSYTDFSYDSSSRVTAITRYLTIDSLTGGSVTTHFAYPSATQTTETDPVGSTTTYTLDTMGRVTAVKNPLGNSRSQTWTSNSDIQTAVDAMGNGSTAGNTTKYTYDTVNNLTAVSTPTGAGAAAQYANQSAQTGSNPSPACTSTDSAHPYLAKCTEDAQGNQSSLAYDTAGNVTTARDSSSGTNSGLSKTYTYQGDSGVASCGGKAGQACSSTTGNGNKTVYAYSSDGALTSVTPPSPGKATSYTYDSLSRLSTVKTPNGVTVTYSYDSRDQHTKTLYSTGGEVDYVYNSDGDLTSQQDSVAGTESYTYDGLDRQLSTTTPGATTPVTVTYSTAGDTATYTDPSGTTKYSYNAANQLTALAEPSGSCTGTITGCTTFTYNANGALLTITYPGNTVQTTTRDASGRATEIKAVNSAGTVLSDLAYTYAKSSKDTALVQTRTDKLGVGGPANSVSTDSYDTLDRLTGVVEKTSAGATNASWAYAYDKDGNRTSNSATLSGTTTTASQGYNAIDELTTLNSSTTGLSYDADGNQTTNPGNTSVGVAPVTATTVNARDQLTAATVAGAATTASYLGETQTDLTSANNGSVTTTFQNALLGLSSETASGSTVSFVRTPGGRLIAARTGSSSVYYLTDNLGSTVGIVNSSGTKTAAYSYDPYGRTRTATGAQAATNAIRYAGGLYNTTSGITKFGARYYDPNTGRFTQPDPSGQESNPYTYAGNNPVGLSDPTGLSIFGNVLQGIGVGLSAVAAFAPGPVGIGLGVAAAGFDVAGGVANGASATDIAAGAAVDVATGFTGPLGEAAGLSGSSLTTLNLTSATAGATYGVGTTYGG